MDLVDIQALVAKMIETFPEINFSHISSKQLLEGEITVQALAIVNFDKLPVRGSKTLNTTIITTNSYGEYFIHDYTTLAQYKTALLTLLTQHEISRWNNNLEIYIIPQPEQHAIQTLLSG